MEATRDPPAEPIHQDAPTSTLVPSMDTSPPPVDDVVLLRRFADGGDRRALDELVLRHADAAFRLAVRCTGNAQDAADVVQDAVLTVMRQAAGFAGRSTVKTWLLGVVVQTAANRRRSETRRTGRQRVASAPAEVPAPFERVAEQETHAALLRSVQELPERCRIPLWLHYAEGLNSNEIGDLLSRPAATVRSQMAEAIALLRPALARLGHGAVPVLAITALLSAAGAAEMASPALRRALTELPIPAPAPASSGSARRVSRRRQRSDPSGTGQGVAWLVGLAALGALIWWMGTGRPQPVPAEPIPVQSVQPSQPSPPAPAWIFVQGINLGGPAVTIDGRRWLGHQEAIAAGLRSTPLEPVLAKEGLVLTPPVDDPGLAEMLGSEAWSKDQPLHLSLPVAPGRHRVWLWVAENYRPGVRDLEISVGGHVVAQDVCRGFAVGRWERLGPYELPTGARTLDLTVGCDPRFPLGAPHLMGVLIERWSGG